MIESIKNILENVSEEELESIIETINNEIFNDTETFRSKARDLLQAYIDNDTDGILIALCGWTLKSILVKADLLPDTEEIFID